MADLSISSISIADGTSRDDIVVGDTLGEAVGLGKMVYRQASDGKLYLGDSTDSSKLTMYGITLHSGSASDLMIVAQDGALVDVGSILTVAETYVLSTAGNLMPIADLVTGDYPVWCGLAKTTSVLHLKFFGPGYQVP